MSKKSLDKFVRDSMKPSIEFSIVSMTSIIIFGIFSLVYSEKNITYENLFILIMIIIAILADIYYINLISKRCKKK